jgi:hypothetical protein
VDTLRDSGRSEQLLNRSGGSSASLDGRGDLGTGVENVLVVLDEGHRAQFRSRKAVFVRSSCA